MTAVGELVLVLGLLVSAHCEVRARDPEVEEDDEELGGGGGGGAPHLERLHPGATEIPPAVERGNYPARTGNWCAFVQRRVVTMAVACGTEKYTIKSQSPCPSGTPDCQLVMYKLSTRPVYRQKQQIVTALLWHCCPGHGGHNCEDTGSDAQLDSGSSALIGGSETMRTELHAPGVQQRRHQLQQQNPHQQNPHQQSPHQQSLQQQSPHQQNPHQQSPHQQSPHQQSLQQQSPHQQSGDPNREQNDHHPLYNTGHQDNQRNTTHPTLESDHGHEPHHASHRTTDTYDHVHHQGQREHHLPVVDDVDTVALPYPEAPAALPVPHMMALVMSQLQPFLEGFNHSLEHLNQQVGALARDVAQLKSNQLAPEMQAVPLARPYLDEAAEERLDAKLNEAFQQIRDIRRQLESQRMDMGNRLHSQHAMLHYNLTSFKTDIDMKLKRHQKMLQVSLQAMNATITELKLDQDQDQDETTEDKLEVHPTPPPHPLLEPLDTSALWEAIERLDNMVVNNTVKVDGLMEDMEVTSGDIQQLRRDFRGLEKHINRTARTSQIQFMETGLEVEAAKEAVLKRVGELAGNLSQYGERLHEMDVDVDYLYETFYKLNMSGDCDCKGLRAALTRLERGVANVTELANENRLALDEDSEGGAGLWGATDEEVEKIQYGLQQVKESLALEHSRTSTLDHSLNQLSSSVMVALDEVSGLKEADRKLLEEMQHLSSSFKSLLADAIQHSDVLELLLGEEVPEFLEWPVQDQEAHSIPALKEQLTLLQEQLRGHDLSISSLLGNEPGDKEEVPSADQPLRPDGWLPGSMRRSSGGEPTRERQLLLHPERRRPEHEGDGSDLWNLERTVEELGQKVLRLEEKSCNTSTEREAPPSGVDAELQAEVTWLKRGLEEHLRVFKNVFSNADTLVASDATLELDKLWQLVKNKEKKRGGGSGKAGSRRSRRESSGVAPVPSSLSGDSRLSVAADRFTLLVTSLNQGQFYFDTGTFRAPLSGSYRFVLALDLRPGPDHVVLRGGWGGARVSLYRREATEAGRLIGSGLLQLKEGEDVILELEGGAQEESDDVFGILHLYRTI